MSLHPLHIRFVLLAFSLFMLLSERSATRADESNTKSGQREVTFLELQAHGLAAIVPTPSGHHFLNNVGIHEQGYDSGRDTIAPFLKASGFEEFSGIAISHPHGDHYGGSNWLFENMKFGQWIDSGYEGRNITEVHRHQMEAHQKFRRLASDRVVKHVAVQAGARLDWDEALEVEVLSPPQEFLSLDSEVVVASCQRDYPSNSHLFYPRSPGNHAAMVFSRCASKCFNTAQHRNVQVVSDGHTYSVTTDRQAGPKPDLQIDRNKNMLNIQGEFPGGMIAVNYSEANCRPGSTDRVSGETVIPHETELLFASHDRQHLQLKCTLQDGVIVEHEHVSLGEEIDFRIGGLKPGKTKKLRGNIYIVPAEIDQLVSRYNIDFPEQHK
jgi:beta-lactamase superfamily II metal-dependent hydrolase